MSSYGSTRQKCKPSTTFAGPANRVWAPVCYELRHGCVWELWVFLKHYAEVTVLH